MNIDGREHVLEHARHDLDVHALKAKIVEYKEWVVGELLFMHPMPLQG